MLLPTWIASLALVLLPVSAQQSRVTRESEDAAEHLGLLRVSAWPEYVARDRRAGFGLRSGPSAQADLASADLSEPRKAAALFALGAARVVSEKPRVLASATEGKTELRTAAIWALGAYQSPGDVETLIELSDKRPMVADAALFALALNGTRGALEHLRAVAADEAAPRNAAAREALGFLSDPPLESKRAREYLDLRFEAARRHGLIDGQTWDLLLLDDLAHSPKFLTRVIYRSASELRRPGVRDHFLEVVLAGGPPDRLRGVVNAMPTELAQLVEEELYTPTDDKEWSAILAEIEHRGLEPLTEPLLRRAWVVPGLRARASVMLARAGASGALQLLDVNLRSTEVDERALAAEEFGRLGDPACLSSLAALESDREPLVRAAALVARVRLGDAEAAAELRARLALDADRLRPRDLDPEGLAAIEALVRASADAVLQPYLVELLDKAPEGAKLGIATVLVLGGREDLRGVVRERLRTERPAGESGVRAVAALGRAPTLADLALLRDLFPMGDEFDVDVELACTLVRQHDREVLPILRAALWGEPWNRSVLAAALWIDVAGLESLRLEAERPPAGVSARDLRRVGFALGEWCGTDEVERLSARVGSADPVLQGAVLGALGARTH